MRSIRLGSMLKKLIAVTIAAAGLSLPMFSPASASAAERVVVIERGLVHCNQVRCTQHRTKTVYDHGYPPFTLHQTRHRAVESRTFFLHATPPWTRWRTDALS